VIAREVRCPVISAGDGRHEHPTQGLLDALAIARAHGRTDGFDLSGLRVTIAGDLANSRVARSTTAALTTLGAAVTLVGPPTLAPGSLAAIGGIVTSDFDAAIADADAVMMLRVQFERLGDGPPLFTTRTYRAGFAMTGERAARLKDNAIILHPGPMNRGLEIDGDVADSDRCIAREQVRLGVPVRMAVMLDLLGASAAAGSRA
jgi:aspartate carbamoyltransferase catalytic subunit